MKNESVAHAQSRPKDAHLDLGMPPFMHLLQLPSHVGLAVGVAVVGDAVGTVVGALVGVFEGAVLGEPVEPTVGAALEGALEGAEVVHALALLAPLPGVCLPLGQAVHLVLAVSLAYVSMAQGVQRVAPAAEKPPGGQGWQAVEALASWSKVPAPQGTQAVVLARHEPAAQGRHWCLVRS